MAARKSRATIKVTAPDSEVAAKTPSFVRRRAAVQAKMPDNCRTTAGQLPDGSPHLSAQGTETRQAFEDHWCSRCNNDDDRAPCPILTKASSNVQPDEWYWLDGKPLCNAFNYQEMTLETDWKTHAVGICNSFAAVPYEPLNVSPFADNVVEVMSAHWCSACSLKPTCAGYQNTKENKMPDYWVWVSNHGLTKPLIPICTKFIALKPVINGYPLIAEDETGDKVFATDYRGYHYWAMRLKGKHNMYRGYYREGKNGAVVSLEKLHHESVLMGAMLRDAIDQISTVPCPSIPKDGWIARVKAMQVNEIEIKKGKAK